MNEIRCRCFSHLKILTHCFDAGGRPLSLRFLRFSEPGSVFAALREEVVNIRVTLRKNSYTDVSADLTLGEPSFGHDAARVWFRQVLGSERNGAKDGICRLFFWIGRWSLELHDSREIHHEGPSRASKHSFANVCSETGCSDRPAGHLLMS